MSNVVNLSIAPGKVDTPIPNDIQVADESLSSFKRIPNYYKDGELADAKEVAADKILQNPKNFFN